ncbi:MAG: flavodoxin family protein [Lachnospiraceae bacterium]|nr:flavodoxin family protein [Lachnospiraceae bacterium]
MKLVGISFGKTMGNTEILMREALMGAQEAGAEISLVRAYDYDIKPCNGCNACTFNPLNEDGLPYCKSNDDFLSFMENILDADGIIFGSPIYQMTPSGYMRLICDRIGPHFDVAVLKGELEMKGAEEFPIDQRIFKPRVAGFICVGGAERYKYVNMVLPLMNLITYPNQIEVVDQLLVMESILTNHVLAHSDKLQRAHELGVHVAQSMGVPAEKLQWYGEESVCPVCHTNLLTLESDDKIMCAVCGMYGKVENVDGKVKVTFPKEAWKESRLTMEEKELHSSEILDFIGRAMPFVMEEAPGLLEKYKKFDVPVVKPKKKA